MAARGPAKESKVEIAKRDSRYLRGSIAAALASDATHLADDQTQVLKFHGVYQQDDRDVRKTRRAEGLDKAYQFLVRCAIPGGTAGAGQYLALSDLADRFGNGTLRLTTRQDVQIHGVLKRNLKQVIAEVNATLLTTYAACGDARRNVMACPAPLATPTGDLIRRLTRQITQRLQPASLAYHEIWLDGKNQNCTGPEEPFYGAQYLPRKFKIGLATASHDCVDIRTHDCGLVAIEKGGEVSGFNMLVGGGLGLTLGKADTVARLAEPFGFIETAHVVDAVETLVAIFRDHGNRSDRRHARLKYLIAEWGIDRLRDEFQRRASFALLPSATLPEPTFDDHLGRHAQGDGKWYCGVFIENGRIADTPDRPLKQTLGAIIAEHEPGVAVTPQQNLLLTGLSESAVDSIERKLRNHGVVPVERLQPARRFSMACPALPTCGLATADAERAMPDIVARFEREFARLGVGDEEISMRMTGCPNGCTRPYVADIAFVGRRLDVYHIYVGGGLRGDRVVDLFAGDVPTGELVEVLRPLITAWARQRQDGEGLSDFYQRRMGRTETRRSITGKEEPTVDLIQLNP